MQRVYSKTIEKPCGFLFARWSAGAKAFELSLPPEKRIIADPLAPYYAGQVGMQMVQAMAAINPSIRQAIVLRARFMDDYSRKCLNEGFEQAVLLGAGYDSRYFRLQEFHEARIFELDLDSTQTIKKALTRKVLGHLPANVTYVPMDFSKDPLIEKLVGAGFDREKRTLFIWEGVTLFLNEDIVSEVLGRLAGLGTGNRVVFDFIPPELVNDETDYNGNRRLLDLCASINEPLTFGSNPERIGTMLRGLGYSGVNITSMRETNKLYTGSDCIENSYYFATAQVGNGNGRSTSSPQARQVILTPGKRGA